MIVLESASRWYGEVIGLNDVSCEIGPGVTALLGQNGAGKSTLMKLVTGQLRPTTGTVRVFGMDPFANIEVYKRLGYCPEIDNFPEGLTGRQFVYRLGRIGGLSDSESEAKTQELLELVSMTDRADTRIRGYSKGMRQRVKLAQALLHGPEAILLDEPLNGLDPVGRREFMDVLAKLSDDGRAILVSSHILFEVEQMTRSIVLLHRGRLLAQGDLGIIRELIDRHPHRIRLRSDRPRELASALIAMPYVVSAQVLDEDREVEVRTREPDRFYDALPALALDQGLSLHGLESPDNNLESVFEYLVG